MLNKFEGHNTSKILMVQSMPMAAAYILTSVSSLILYAFLKDLPETIYALSLAGYAAIMIIRKVIASICDGVLIAGTILEAEAYGQNETKKMWSVAIHVLTICITFSTILSAGIIVFGKPLLIFCSSDIEAANIVFPTFVFLIATTPLWIIGMQLALLLRSVGDVRFSSMMSIINAFGLVILSAILIPQLGLIGAAMAYVINFGIINNCFYLWVIFSGRSALKPIKGIHIDKDIMKEILTLGFPISIKSLVNNGGLALLVSSISSYGAVVISAWQASKDIVSFGLAPATAAHLTSSAIVSARQGVRTQLEQNNDLKLCIGGFVKYAFVISILIAILLTICMPFIPEMITNDRQVIEIICSIIPIYIITIILGTFSTILSGILQGLKKTKQVAIVSVVTSIISLWLYPMIIVHLASNYQLVIAAQAFGSGLCIIIYAMILILFIRKLPNRFSSGNFSAVCGKIK